MKSRAKDRIEKLSATILAIEIEINIINDDIEVIERNLNYLNSIKEGLEYNIDFHKTGGKATVITQYKRSIQELDMTKKEIIKSKALLARTKSKLAKKNESYTYYAKEYEEAFLDFESECRVLPFKGGSDE